MTAVNEQFDQPSPRKTEGKQVRLRLVYIDFWSAVKLSFLAAVAIAIVTLVSFLFIQIVLQVTGLVSTLDDFIGLLTDNTVSVAAILSLPQVMAFAAVVAIINLVVVTLMGAVVAGVYNLAVKVTGGLLVGFTSS